MDESTLKILKMLEEGKISVEEAQTLLNSLGKAAGAQFGEPQHDAEHPAVPHFTIPPIPPVPPIPPIPPVPPVPPMPSMPVRGISLQGVRLDDVDLRHSEFTGVKLEGAQLKGADLSYSAFTNADLRGADLRGARLNHASFVGANLRNADLRNAELNHSSFTGADFEDAQLPDAVMNHCDLSRADFHGVVHPGLVLKGVSMPGLKYRPAADEAEEASGAVETLVGEEPAAGAPEGETEEGTPWKADESKDEEQPESEE